MNLEKLTDQELTEKINSMTKIMNNTYSYQTQHENYKKIQFYWDEFHKRKYFNEK